MENNIWDVRGMYYVVELGTGERDGTTWSKTCLCIFQVPFDPKWILNYTRYRPDDGKAEPGQAERLQKRTPEIYSTYNMGMSIAVTQHRIIGYPQLWYRQYGGGPCIEYANLFK